MDVLDPPQLSNSRLLTHLLRLRLRIEDHTVPELGDVDVMDSIPLTVAVEREAFRRFQCDLQVKPGVIEVPVDCSRCEPHQHYIVDSTTDTGMNEPPKAFNLYHRPPPPGARYFSVLQRSSAQPLLRTLPAAQLLPYSYAFKRGPEA